MGTDDVVLMLVGATLVCLMLLRLIVLVFFHAPAICRTLRRWLTQLLLPLNPRKKSAEELRLADEIQRVRLALSHRALALYATLSWVIMAAAVVNIFLESPRYLNMEATWLFLALMATLTVYAFLPWTLCRHTLDFWYALFTLVTLLYASPWCTPVARSFDALLLCIFVRLPSSIMATRTLWVVVGNSLVSLLIILRNSIDPGGESELEGNSFAISLVIGIEFSSFFLAVVFAAALTGWMWQRAELGRENSKISSDLSAVSMLLRLMSDAVVELDQDLRLQRHSPELSAMLLRDRPGSSLEGVRFTEFVYGSEAARAAELLQNPACVLSTGQGTSAHAFHTRLVDTFTNKVCIEVFHVQVLSSDGEVRHLLGLRDFTDSASLSGERATDAMDQSLPSPMSPASLDQSPVASHLLPEVMEGWPSQTSSSWRPQEEPPRGRQAFLEVDMEVKVVHSASASVAFLAGSALTDFFTAPHTVQLLQRICDEAQRGLDQEGTLPQKVFNYQDLPVRWSAGHYGTIHGTFQVVQSRFGRIGVVISFSEPNLLSPMGRRTSKSSGRSSATSKKQRSFGTSSQPARSLRPTHARL
ncbi:FCPF [Symbiodinium natans]|uniref:FCPF protein n=1 Tax=Symbiodinium natans TaxID=878477 RepID=A0A812K080_9DINO|nr:FCPF [Symbiodinium natans]